MSYLQFSPPIYKPDEPPFEMFSWWYNRSVAGSRTERFLSTLASLEEKEQKCGLLSEVIIGEERSLMLF